ncbi:MAG TPA: hypothetical protein VNZ52_09370, partial [Candidatus Thermoplasmatota archaeon]|nr:hypothetical protein [Candidatus Thermoplasmatota archaeon]
VVGPDVQFEYLDTRRGDWTADAYQSGLITSPGGSILNGMHIVVWVGPAQNIDAKGNVVGIVEGPNGWRTASVRDVDYFNAAGEGAAAGGANVQVTLLGLLSL